MKLLVLLRSSRTVLVMAMAGLGVLCTIYLWQERYFLRFLPIPLQAIDVLYQFDGILPLATPMEPQGTFDFPEYDLTTENGLRLALNRLQLESPFSMTTPKPFDYTSITFQSWIEQMKVVPYYCTDASMLFMLVAWKQGLVARQWQLLTPNWRAGQGHSIVEYYNPKTDKWLLVDPQHAGILRNQEGHILDMRTLLAHYEETQGSSVVVDYGFYTDVIRAKGRGPTTEDYLFKGKGLSVPVLTLRPPTWYARAKQNDLIIGYPIFTSSFVHQKEVLTTKLVAVFFVFVFMALSILGFRIFRRR